MALDTAKSGKKFGKVAMGKVQQAIPSADANVTSVSNRVSTLEGYNLHSRLTTAEGKITTLEGQVATLMSQMASMLTHKHDYDDGGVAEVTGLPRQ